MFHPFDDFAIELFLKGDVRHGGGGSGAVPVFFAGFEPDDVPGMNFFDGAAFALGPAAAGGNDERLAEGVRVPRGAGAGFEGDVGALNEGGIGCMEQRVNADCAGEPVGRAFR